MKMTVAGDIRRIRRNILKPNGNGMVIADYGELHKVFADIETKEREYKSLVKELSDALEKFESIGVDCSCCGIPCDRNDRDNGCIVDEIRPLVAKAREVCK